MNQYIIPFLVSMVPLIELRGAIPIAQSMGLPIMTSYLVCIVGNMIPVPFIYLFARKVLEWGADKPVIGGFLPFVLKKDARGAGNLLRKQAEGHLSPFFSLSVFRCLEQEPGPERLRQAFWIWTSSRQFLRLCWECSSQVLL